MGTGLRFKKHCMQSFIRQAVGRPCLFFPSRLLAGDESITPWLPKGFTRRCLWIFKFLKYTKIACGPLSNNLKFFKHLGVLLRAPSQQNMNKCDHVSHKNLSFLNLGNQSWLPSIRRAHWVRAIPNPRSTVEDYKPQIRQHHFKTWPTLHYSHDVTNPSLLNYHLTSYTNTVIKQR